VTDAAFTILLCERTLVLAERTITHDKEAGTDLGPVPRGTSGLGDEAKIGAARRIGY
jgi:hypothetical protein